MKQILQYQMKIKTTMFHKTNIGFIAIYIIFAGCSHSALDKNITLNENTIDSIYVLTTNLYTYTSINIGKDDFIAYYNHSKDKKFHIIKQHDDKVELIHILTELKNIECDNRIILNDFTYKPIFSGEHIYLINTDYLNIRSQLVIFTQKYCILVWISVNYTDIQNHRYYTSEDLRRYIQNLHMETSPLKK